MTEIDQEAFEKILEFANEALNNADSCALSSVHSIDINGFETTISKSFDYIVAFAERRLNDHQ